MHNFVKKWVFSLFLQLKYSNNKNGLLSFLQRIFAHFLLTRWRSPQLSCSTDCYSWMFPVRISTITCAQDTPASKQWLHAMTLIHDCATHLRLLRLCPSLSHHLCQHRWCFGNSKGEPQTQKWRLMSDCVNLPRTDCWVTFFNQTYTLMLWLFYIYLK